MSGFVRCLYGWWRADVPRGRDLGARSLAEKWSAGSAWQARTGKGVC